MAHADVVIPVSTEPIIEAAAVFLSAMAFPLDERKREKFVSARCKQMIMSAARANPGLAWTPQPLKPGYLMLTDVEADQVLKAANKQLQRRKHAFFATQVHFEEAFQGRKFQKLIGEEGPLANTVENNYLMTHFWLKDKKPGSSTKPLIRDAITPSKPVIHMVYALWRTILLLCQTNVAKNEEEAWRIIFENKDILSAIIYKSELCRVAAIGHPALRVGENDLIKFVAA